MAHGVEHFQCCITSLPIAADESARHSQKTLSSSAAITRNVVRFLSLSLPSSSLSWLILKWGMSLVGRWGNGCHVEVEVEVVSIQFFMAFLVQVLNCCQGYIVLSCVLCTDS